VFALAVLLALPVFAEGETSLTWWSAEDGAPKKDIEFSVPVCDETGLTCWVGDTKLASCDSLDLASEVAYVAPAAGSTQGYFQAKALPEARVNCFITADRNTPYTGSDLNAQGITCILADSKFKIKRWDSVFIPYDEWKVLLPRSAYLFRSI
jgi:hypothetical protein